MVKKHREWKRSRNRKYAKQRSESISSTTSTINCLLDRLTDIRVTDYDRLAKVRSNQTLLNNFSRLHVALHDLKNPEVMWEAYQDLRKVPEDVSMLSQDVLRLLIIRFKEASNSYSPRENNDRSKLAWNQTWNARIVTVLNDKRVLLPRFSRWDYSDMMSALNRLGRYDESLEEFERVVDSKYKVDPILLNHAVRAWGGLGRLDKAIQVIQDVRAEDGAKPSEYTLGYLIQQYLSTGQKSEAIRFWRDLTEDSTLESIETVNGILRACVKVQDSKFAQTVYDSLSKLGVESNLESLSLMLSLAVSEIQYPDERIEFLSVIQTKIATSNKPVFGKGMLDSLLSNFSKKGDAEGAILVCQLMANYGYPPDIEKHNEILHCYARLGQMDNAVEWFQQMRREGIRPNRASYVLLMQSYSRQRMPRETEALFRQLITDGIEPDLATCNYMLLAYEQARMNRRCLQLYRGMLQDRSIGVDQFTLSCMFNAVFHSDKAFLEGGEGLKGRGSALNNALFLDRIGQPIAPSTNNSEQNHTPLQTKDSRVRKFYHGMGELQPLSHPLPSRQQYQFDNAISTTTSLNPRTLFRDMIMVGIRPSRSLYSNILRAFLVQNDYAGAAVALRTLVDYYVLKPTPKMNAVVVTWVCQELERRGISGKDNALTKGELSKLINMMGRARGLIDMVEKVVNIERWGQEDTTDDDVETPAPSQPDVAAAKSEHRSIIHKGFPANHELGALARAKLEMGGDLVDLDSRSVVAGSSWNTTEDDTVQVDLKDFERWYRAYSNRTTYAQAIKANPPLSEHT
ncbi:hypothetical protein BGZ54_005027 [Gamsiella multidivaricata]|nr:hypothetical protein BGZ54_005027 [Gamsiella multidivaricata]